MTANFEELLKSNLQWQSGEFQKPRFDFKRSAWKEITPWLNSQQIIALTGLRRVGKSTLLDQLQSEFFKEKDPSKTKNLMRFSFEVEDFQERLPQSTLTEILDYYFHSILNVQPAALQDKVLVVLDEIQNVANWPSVVKRYYDLCPQIKFLVSGSSALFLKEDSESLAGRIIEREISPLSFEEFLGLVGINNTGFSSSIAELFEATPRLITGELTALFEQFLLSGGFPEAATLLRDGMPLLERQHYIRDSIVKRIVSRDFRRFYGVANTLKDFELFSLLCFENGGTINVKKLANKIQYAESTLVKHLDIFEFSGLARRLKKFETKKRKVLNSKFKFYPTSPSLIMSVLGIDHLKDSRFVGHLAETYAHQRLTKLVPSLFFAQNNSGKEIDFYSDKKKFAIECKYGLFEELDLEFLTESAKSYSLNPLVITKDRWESGNLKIKAVPLMFV